MKKVLSFKALCTLILALCLVFSLALPAFAASSSVSATSWMEDIDGDLTLAQFTIPGTHDSCTQKCVLGRCQHVGVKTQLNYGVRFLDIRLKYDDGDLNCYHGFVNCFVTFETVMEQVSAFLEAHPSECIIMSIKNEGDECAEFEQTLVNDWIESEEYADLFYTENAIPKLDDVRGQIVLMRRYNTYDTQLERGINARNNWADNATFTIERDGFNIVVQDCYSYDTAGLTFGKDKWTDFVTFDRAMQIINEDNLANCLWLNFASACNKIGAGQLSCSEVVNYNIRKDFKTASGNHGVVIMDYVTKDIVQLVAESNFR